MDARSTETAPGELVSEVGGPSSGREATCGLELHLDGGEIALVRGDRDDVFSKGYLCPKGTAIKQLERDPDRIRTPMIRTGDAWREVTWPEAFAEIDRRLTEIRGAHGNDAVAGALSRKLARTASGLPPTGLT